MMYKIVKNRRAWWSVTWSGVTEEGRVVENKIEMRFRLLKVDDFVKLTAEANEVQKQASERRAAGEEGSVARTFAEVVERIVEDWRGVAGENGEPLPFTTDNLALLMDEPQLFDRVLFAWREALAGGPKERAGN